MLERRRSVLCQSLQDSTARSWTRSTHYPTYPQRTRIPSSCSRSRSRSTAVSNSMVEASEQRLRKQSAVRRGLLWLWRRTAHGSPSCGTLGYRPAGVTSACHVSLAVELPILGMLFAERTVPVCLVRAPERFNCPWLASEFVVHDALPHVEID